MKLKEFLKDKILYIVGGFITVLFSQTLLSILDIDFYAIVLIELLFILNFFIPITIEYLRRNHYYKNVYQILDNLDKEFFLSEVMEEPNFIEGQIFYDIIKRCNKSMNDEIACYKLEQIEYQDYIEMWIHEVKTPIASTKLMIENHSNNITNSIEEEIDKVDDYLEQALYYARSRNASKDYIIREVKLQDVVNSVIRKNAKTFIREKIRLEINDLDEIVYTDIKWTNFILNQIIINAIKYKKEDAKITISKKKLSHCVILIIEDNGIGIPMNDLPRIMEKGYTGATGRRYAKSTGIGLYLCKSLCDKLGLSINVGSTEGIGTTVSIVFPAQRQF